MTEAPTLDQPSAPPVRPRRVPTVRLLSFAVASMVIGALASWIWSRVVTLPSYLILPDGSARVTERGLTEFFAADATFVLCGAVAGLALGVAAWLIFRPLGWLSAVIAMFAGLLAGLMCWQLGQLFGPGPFDQRLAAAKPGELVPVPLELRSVSALAVWGFAAVAPILLGSALGRDEEAPRPVRRRRRPDAAEPIDRVDDRGVLTEGPTETTAP